MDYSRILNEQRPLGDNEHRYHIRLHGKESIEVRITQNKGKQSENS